eukprot:GHVU01142437.1.p1 GENE.GHVU01142437.1~~GHVU01142437.1.p1  ORF type:complete len:105 (-),score=7.16 GHVU01142437.1:417-731(-)
MLLSEAGHIHHRHHDTISIVSDIRPVTRSHQPSRQEERVISRRSRLQVPLTACGAPLSSVLLQIRPPTLHAGSSIMAARIHPSIHPCMDKQCSADCCCWRCRGN